ncbi:hypothetical protein BU15DRAFT_79541 [Melanogaster broomeanus]|nr:hypothetical protein BU15DRAFT_79541 [Melanogaster broomeanus]
MLSAIPSLRQLNTDAIPLSHPARTKSGNIVEKRTLIAIKTTLLKQGFALTEFKPARPGSPRASSQDRSLDEAACEKAVHDLRRNSLLLDQHMKIITTDEVFVRRLVHGSAEVKDFHIPAADPIGAPDALASSNLSSLGKEGIWSKSQATFLQMWSSGLRSATRSWQLPTTDLINFALMAYRPPGDAPAFLTTRRFS